ncbi:hypothetical protein [Streptomyces sp. NPDC059597]|uniref:hypothetical protein n=1 Tax=Streptomyces sp. NPDC059597 TaxID=3346879 RepID=UPI0036A5766A
MASAAGLLLALACLAITAVGLALAIVAWRPQPGSGPAPALLCAAALVGAAGALLLAVLHWIAHLLTL